jgi:hypothetical protein
MADPTPVTVTATSVETPSTPTATPVVTPVAAPVAAPTTDLTWANLASNLPPGAIAIVNGKVMIDPGIILNKPITDINSTGVVACAFEIFKAGNKAQAGVNAANDVIGNRIQVFSNPQPGGVATDKNGDYYIPFTAQLNVRIPIVNAQVIGINF